MPTVFIGYDGRQGLAYRACARSLRARARGAVVIQPISRHFLGPRYRRPTEERGKQLWDVISDAPMATDFALARFWVPLLQPSGWAIFCDNDFLWRAPVEELLELADDRYAVMVVQHDHHVKHEGVMKMDGRLQTGYPRKNWSSLMLMNCSHPAFGPAYETHLNSASGRSIHGFEWLPEEQIGALPPYWNHLVDISVGDYEPRAVHFTLGTPNLAGYEAVPFADEWRSYAD